MVHFLMSRGANLDYRDEVRHLALQLQFIS